MKVFVTGATGFVGSVVVRLLQEAGHGVVGLARSDASVRVLEAQGVEVHRGDLRDAATLRAGAEACEAVVHTAFVHDFSEYVENCELDRRAVMALGSALRGTTRPMLVTSGIVGGIQLENDRLPPGASKEVPRAASEEAADALATEGVRVGVVRLPPTVHGRGDGGLIPMMIEQAKRKSSSAYIRDGNNLWSAVARADAAEVFVLGLQHVRPGIRYHAVAESGVPFRRIAETIGSQLGVPTRELSPDDAAAHFGPLAWLAGLNSPASSSDTRKCLGWSPPGPTLLDDLANTDYFA